jgi:hypothetical protein
MFTFCASASTEGLLELIGISAPPAGAGLLRSIVRVIAPPLVTVEGEMVTEDSVGSTTAVRVALAVLVAPPELAVTVTGVLLLTVVVCTVIAAWVWPRGTVTDDGTGKAALLLLSDTVTPPVGAAALSVIVTDAVEPDVTDDGEIETPVSVAVGVAAGVNVTVVVLVTDWYAAATVTAVDALTAFVCTVTEPEVCPAGTVTLAATGKALLLLERETVAPPLGAAPVSVTVTVALDPPVRLDGLTVTELNVAEDVEPDGVIVRVAVLVVPW